MANYKTFYDEGSNELRVYINSKGNLFIATGNFDDEYFNGYISIDKGDVYDLIKELQRLIKLM